MLAVQGRQEGLLLDLAVFTDPPQPYQAAQCKGLDGLGLLSGVVKKAMKIYCGANFRITLPFNSPIRDNIMTGRGHVGPIIYSDNCFL